MRRCFPCLIHLPGRSAMRSMPLSMNSSKTSSATISARCSHKLAFGSVKCGGSLQCGLAARLEWATDLAAPESGLTVWRMGAGADEQNVIRADGPIHMLTVAFDQRQQVALNPFMRLASVPAVSGRLATLSSSSMNTMPVCSTASTALREFPPH